ncbi:MAG: hypothetical protein M9894_10150 [Planctomycetes bacterium]|nr:hypothetical protein [Planctomycetota bacterium]
MAWARTGALTCAAALCAALASGEEGPRRFDLRTSYPFRQGDRVRIVQGSKHEGLANVLQRGKPVRVENKRGGFELRYVDEVQALGPGGGIMRVQRTYERVKDWATGQEERRPRRVVLDYSGEHMHYTPQDELPEAARELLEGAAKVPLSAFQHLYPEDLVVALGQKWTIPNAPAAQLFRLDPAAVVEARSTCRGTLDATRQHHGAEQVRLVFDFRLAFTRLYDLTFDPPAELEVRFEVWESVDGAAPTGTGTIRGSIKGTGRLEGAPKDLTVQLQVTVSGTYQQELLGTAR